MEKKVNMNRLSKFVRIVLALMFTLGAIGFSASAVLAAPPVSTNYQDYFTETDTTTCGFTIDITVMRTVHEIKLYDQNGQPTQITLSVVEQNTFKANNITLIGDAYHYEGYGRYDSNGTFVVAVTNGVAEKIRLPSGGLLFISTGHTDWLTHSGFSFSTDIGNPGDIEAFCAAFGS
jgi:hypothetical protein